MPTEQQPEKSFLERDTPRGCMILYYVVFGLLTIAPFISVAIAAGIADACGCRLDEGNAHSCILFGVEVGPLLYRMFVAGWYFLITFPTGGLFICVMAYQQHCDKKRRRADADSAARRPEDAAG